MPEWSVPGYTARQRPGDAIVLVGEGGRRPAAPMPALSLDAPASGSGIPGGGHDHV